MNPARKLKLLIVEDEPDICTTAQSYFSKRNFIVSTTGSGTEALLSMIKSSRPDIVLLDLALNDLGGLEALKILREYDQETKVVIITGQQYSDEEVEKIELLGISGYKDKPLILQDVEKLVYETLGLAKPDVSTLSANKSRPAPARAKGVGHQLSNLLGIIRNKCENYTLSIEEGIYRDKTPDELVKMSVGIMKDIQQTVDKTMDVVEQIKEYSMPVTATI